MPWTGPMFLAAALALCGLPLSGVFRSEFQIVAGGFAEPQYVGVSILLVFVNLAFFGVLWHAGRMVLTAPAGRPDRPSPATPPREQSAWMVAAMLVCLVIVVALGLHLPTALSTLIAHARHLLLSPTA
jgi:hydrogenase-4 component F